MIFLLGFLLGVALDWYENKFIVLDVVRRPLFLSTATNQLALFSVRLLVTYGSLAGLFFVYGAGPTVVAFVTYWVISSATFRTYFNREVRSVTKVLIACEKLTEAEAFEYAVRVVTGNIKSAGRGWEF
jgi:hypothetical protein